MDGKLALRRIEHLRAIKSLMSAALELIYRLDESEEDLKRAVSIAQFGASRSLAEQMERCGYIRPMREDELHKGDFPAFVAADRVLV